MNNPSAVTGYAQNELIAALEAIADMLARSQKAIAKFRQGSAQHTLLSNRNHALDIASALVKRQLTGEAHGEESSSEQLKIAAPPIASLISKSEKARQKLLPGSWQHTMLEANIKALRIASALLNEELEAAATALPPQN